VSSRRAEAPSPIVLVAVDLTHRGLSRLVDRSDTATFLLAHPKELHVQLAGARALRDDNPARPPIVVVAPSGQPALLARALRGGADRVVSYHVAEAPRSRWTEIALRAVGAVVDWTITPDALSFASAIRLGADPDRTDVLDVERGDLGELLATVLAEPARRQRSGGTLEVVASLALDTLEVSGALAVAERWGRSRGVNVVNYHRVLPVDELRTYGRPQMAIAQPVFEAQLELMAHGGFTTLDAVRAPEAAGKVAITFDDGYEDNFRVALPILERFSAPACVFLVTALIGEPGALWWDRVGLSLFAYWRSGAATPIPADLPRSARALEHVRSFHAAREAIAQTLSELNAVDHEQRARAVAAAEGLVSALSSPRTMLSWDEVRQMREAGLSFGAHTRSHVCLDEIPPEAAREELVGSLDDLDAQLASTGLRTAALPRGRLGPLAEDELRALGFASIMSTTAGLNTPTDASLLVKRRDGNYLTLRGRHHPAKLRLELTGLLDGIRPHVHE
jgi:peptidoglycan/xylan/chitin deacetylase (PgdA/CDA1 family)